MPDQPSLFGEPHRRFDPLRGEWVLVSPGRTNRPWQGGEETPADDARPRYDPACYLCPGNTRASGEVNPAYDGTFVFTNDFAALRPDTSTATWDAGGGLLRAIGERGTARVLCFSPRHDLTLARMAPDEVRTVVDAWAAETAALGEQFAWVQVFENRGEAMGASNPHPHGQIWAQASLPREAVREAATQQAHLAARGSRLLLDVAAAEADGPRVVEQSAGWLAIVPFWAVWPFETLVIPRTPAGRLTDLDDARRDDLGRLLVRMLRRYDGLFGVPFPYSMGWHQAPFGAADAGEPGGWQLHAHAYPPLLRSAAVRKFMVGYELLSEPQRDLTPEEAAERLRAVPIGA